MLSSQLLPVYGGRRRKLAEFNHPPQPPGNSFYKYKHFARCRIGYNIVFRLSIFQVAFHEPQKRRIPHDAAVS